MQKENFFEVPDLPLAAALTALNCPLFKPCAGLLVARPGEKPIKKFFFAACERSRRLAALWYSEIPDMDEGELTLEQEKLVIRFMRQASVNRMDLLKHINKSTDLAVLKRGEGYLLMPMKLKNEGGENGTP